MNIKMLTSLENRVQELSETFNRYCKYKNGFIIEKYSKWNFLKNPLDEIYSRLADGEECTRNLTHRVLENTK